MRPVMIIADEYHAYATESILRIIKESRKFGAELILASQEVVAEGSKIESLQRSVLKTVGTLICGRVGSDDAKIILNDLFTFQDDEIKYMRPANYSQFGVDYYWEEPIFYSMDEKKEFARSALVDLPDREFYVKQRGRGQARHFRTLDVPKIPKDATALARLDDEAFRRFGLLRGSVYEVDDELPAIPPATPD